MYRFGRTLVWLGVAAPLLSAGPVAAQQASVQPGINEAFQDPDVDQFVERFEREGREVFDKRHQIVAACNVQPGMAVADVGAGTGLFTRLIAREVGPQGRVFAVDIARAFVERTEASARQAGLHNVVGVVCREDHVGLPPASVDLVLLCDTYHHFEFPRETLQSIHACLRPKGKLILIDFHRIEGTSSDWVLGHVRADKETFSREIVDAGFDQVGELRGLLDESYFVRFEKR